MGVVEDGGNVNVVRSISLVTELTFPTDGKPMRATLASPDFWTSKPVPAPPDLLVGSRSCARYRASFAFNRPK